MTIVHRKGCDHTNADALSRIGDSIKSCNCYSAGAELKDLPCGGCPYCTRAHHQWSRFSEEVDDVVPLAVNTIYASEEVFPESGSSNWVEGLSPDQLRQEQLSDPDLEIVVYWLEHDYDPSHRELLLTSPTTRALWSCRHCLILKNGILYYSWSDHPKLGSRLCLVIPQSLKQTVLFGCHDSKASGHLGIEKTVNRLKDKFYWYGMTRDTELYVKGCKICNKNKKGNRSPRAGQQLYHAGYPMERVHIDIMGPFHISSKGNRYILVMVDQFTKWVELAAIPEQNAQITVKAFVEKFISTFGCPLEIHSDQGRNFESNLFQAFCEILEITKTRTTPYRPCSNGQCEVYNRVIVQIVRSFISKGLKDWDEHLPMISMALHSMKNPTTGFSANKMMLGRETIQPLDLMIGHVDFSPVDSNEWVENLVGTMTEVHHLAREQIGQAQLRQKRDYDLRIRERAFNVADPVYLRNSSTKVGVSAKLVPPWTGPFIVSVAKPPLYTIESYKKSMVVHHDRLKLCRDRELPLWLKRKRQFLLELPEDPTLDSEDPLTMDPIEDNEPEGEVDLDRTLPYMLPDVEENQVPIDLGSEDATQPPVEPPVAPAIKTRRGREVKMPARFL